MDVETEVKIKEAAILVAQVALLSFCVVASAVAVTITKVSSTLGVASEYMRTCREDKEDGTMINWRDNDPVKIITAAYQIVKGLIVSVPKNGAEDTPSQVDEAPDETEDESNEVESDEASMANPSSKSTALPNVCCDTPS